MGGAGALADPDASQRVSFLVHVKGHRADDYCELALDTT